MNRLRGIGITRKPSTKRAAGAKHALQYAARSRMDTWAKGLKALEGKQDEYDTAQEKLKPEDRQVLALPVPPMLKKLSRFIFRPQM